MDILQAIATAARCVGKRTTIPILGHVRLVSDDGILSVTGTDMDRRYTALADYRGPSFDVTLPARELLAQVLAPGSVRENAYWRDAGNVKRTMTYADLQALGRAISDRGYDADENLETKKAAVNAASTAEEIDAVTW